ncbi:MAG: DUF3800 domain-containing protein [Verrucomicrobia bacterium]|nr:DUF3800 domain-containing protein [Verrucomicrobiota bacterium]
MYFFYFDESGSRDPQVTGTRQDGTTFSKDHLYVLTALALFERRWHAFDRAVANLKLELADHLHRTQQLKLTLAECEVKSGCLRIPAKRAQESPFLSALGDADRHRLSETFFEQVPAQRMILFAAVMDKRKLLSHMDAETMHKKAYELLLERIEHYLSEFHPKHQGLIVMDDTQRQLNHAVAMKHAFFQREGNRNVQFRHIVEYPFFTDSKLSNGIQLADLCAYNVHRAFRTRDFNYPYFARLLPALYCSRRTASDKLDGLKVFPDDSELVAFAAEGARTWLQSAAVQDKRPALQSGPKD